MHRQHVPPKPTRGLLGWCEEFSLWREQASNKRMIRKWEETTIYRMSFGIRRQHDFTRLIHYSCLSPIRTCTSTQTLVKVKPKTRPPCHWFLSQQSHKIKLSPGGPVSTHKILRNRPSTNNHKPMTCFSKCTTLTI